MGQVREVKKSFCLLSAAYIILGLVLLIWPDISVRTFCYVFGIGMIILGCAHMIMYFTKDRMQSVMQMDMVIGIVGIATGAYILLKMEYMLEIIPFALGVVALLGSAVKLQNAFDLKRLNAGRWYIMLLFAAVLLVLGAILVANPFEGLEIIVLLIGASLILDGVGNLIGIFWIGYRFKHPLDAADGKKDRFQAVRTVEAETVEDVDSEADTAETAVVPKENTTIVHFGNRGENK